MIVKRLFASLVIGMSLFVGVAVALPKPASAAVAAGCDNSIKFLGLPTWYKYLDVGPKGVDKCAIIGPTDPATGRFDWKLGGGRVALAIVDILLRIGAMVAVGFVIYGGFRYILSQGEPENAKHARNTILNAIIGLVITIFATLIVNFIGGILT